MSLEKPLPCTCNFLELGSVNAFYKLKTVTCQQEMWEEQQNLAYPNITCDLGPGNF